MTKIKKYLIAKNDEITPFDGFIVSCIPKIQENLIFAIKFLLP